jgi:hypothetical protein
MPEPFPVTPESLTREILQAVTLLRERGESSPGCVTIRTTHLTQIDAKLQLLLDLLTGEGTPAMLRKMRPLVRAIDRHFDRLAWSSDTALPGEPCLDVFSTTEAGIVAVEHAEGTMCFYGGPLLAILEQLPDGSEYDELWQAMQPARVKD